MIDFPCKCGYNFSVPEDLTGGLVQCPRCKLLVDIPTVTQFREMEDDGTIKIEPLPPPETGRLQSLERAFNPSRVDDYGVEYDLRSSPDEIAMAGEPTAEEVEARGRPDPPRYDPETGEIIRPLDLAPQRAVPVIPIPQNQQNNGPGRTLSYARGLAAEVPITRRYPLLLAMFMGGNSVVMLMVFFIHVLANLLTLALWVKLWFVIAIPLAILMALLAHYANVVEETGVFERDELPTPLRHAQWSEDIWQPFVAMFFSLMLCYGPAVAVGFSTSGGLALIPFLLGSLFFPAIFLTLTTSGTILNLRPDRVLGVIAHCGFRYFISVALWVMAAVIYGPAIINSTMLAKNVGRSLVGRIIPWDAGPLSYVALFVGIFLAHLFCWHLGLLYRQYHEQFPWILQRYTPKDGKPVERRKPRYAQKKEVGPQSPAPDPHRQVRRA